MSFFLVGFSFSLLLLLQLFLLFLLVGMFFLLANQTAEDAATFARLRTLLVLLLDFVGAGGGGASIFRSRGGGSASIEGFLGFLRLGTAGQVGGGSQDGRFS